MRKSAAKAMTARPKLKLELQHHGEINVFMMPQGLRRRAGVQAKAQCHEGKELSREGERLERRVVKID